MVFDAFFLLNVVDARAKLKPKGGLKTQNSIQTNLKTHLWKN